MNVIEDAEREKSWLEAMKKSTKSKSSKSPGQRDKEAREAKEVIAKKLKRDADRDLAVMKRVKEMRKAGESPEEVNRLFKHLSGAKKRKAARSIAKSIE